MKGVTCGIVSGCGVGGNALGAIADSGHRAEAWRVVLEGQGSDFIVGPEISDQLKIDRGQHPSRGRSRSLTIHPDTLGIYLRDAEVALIITVLNFVLENINEIRNRACLPVNADLWVDDVGDIEELDGLSLEIQAHLETESILFRVKDSVTDNGFHKTLIAFDAGEMGLNSEGSQVLGELSLRPEEVVDLHNLGRATRIRDDKLRIVRHNRAHPEIVSGGRNIIDVGEGPAGIDIHDEADSDVGAEGCSPDGKVQGVRGHETLNVANT